VGAVPEAAGRDAASASRDPTDKVARLTGAGPRALRAEAVQTLLGPDESVKCVGLLGDPDAPVVLAGSYDFGLYAWRVDWDATAHTLSRGTLLTAFDQGLSCMAPLDGDNVAVAGWDGRIVVVTRGPDGEPRLRRAGRIEDLAARSARHEEALAV
jgi:hypothetical protein